MRFSATIAALAASIPFTTAYYKGFNVGANNEDGSCKTTDQWATAFNKLKALPQGITSVRLYASSDCNTLEYAVPAALETGIQILVGIWTEDSAHYAAEKQALLDAINAHGSDWILAVSVGSEDLYRKDTDANTLAQQVYDVRGMIRQFGIEAEVGHVDTWTAWVDSANDAVIEACDFVGMDGYPYWQDASIDDAYNVFFTSYDNTLNHVNSVKSGVWVWITETGWPVSGESQGAATASAQNAASYWNSVACQLFQMGHVFWYAYQDYSANPSFGIFDSNGNAIYDTASC